MQSTIFHGKLRANGSNIIQKMDFSAHFKVESFREPTEKCTHKHVKINSEIEGLFTIGVHWGGDFSQQSIFITKYTHL